MYRATTPQHDFLFDVDPQTTFKRILITYAQNNQIVLEKTEADLTYSQVADPEDGTIYKASFRMTQEETKKFDPNTLNVQLQLRFRDWNDHVVASPVVKIRLDKVLNDEVLT